jgi:aspartyl-tRNA synthetase
MKSFRNYLTEKGCIEIQPPCIIGAASEGGTEVFALPYFEKEAFLAQSPQLYKQMGAVSFGKVFTVTPVWRAEKHNTHVHLNEIRQMDMEMGFIKSEEDVMKFAEEVFARMLKDIKDSCKEEMELLGMKINVPELPFRRVTYKECIDELQKKGEEIKWGDDFSKAQEKMMGEIFGEVFFLKDWPEEVKPFYTMPNKDGKTCRAFDIIYKGLEILSGTQRIHIPDLLIERIKVKGLNPENFKSYIDCFRYGAPPHGGWSFGLERLTMTLVGLKNIREATMFPRDRHRLNP